MKRERCLALVEEIFSLIPDKEFDRIGEEEGVDWNVSRLFGKYMVKLLIFGLVREDNVSTRTLEKLYNSIVFSVLAKKGDHQTRHSSIASRINTMSPSYFEAIYDSLLSRIPPRRLRRDKRYANLVRFDSTMRQISNALIASGMRVGSEPKEGYRKLQLKLTLGLRGLEGLPDSVEHFDDQAHLSEQRALREAILANTDHEKDTAIFDMGLSDRQTFATFDREGLAFVTRGKSDLKYHVVEPFEGPENQETDGLEILEDNKAYLFQDGGKLLEHPFRVIKAKNSEGEVLFFITNIWDQPATTVAEFYRLRWDIEVFFRFIKQELSFSHLISHQPTGIYNQVLATMITALMLLIFKEKARIEGYKDAVIYFEHGILLWLIKELVDKLEPKDIQRLIQGRSQLFIKLLE